MKKDDLARLHWIRKQREEKALNAVIARQNALLHAERAAAEAARASADHASSIRDRERGALVAQVGKELRRPDILNFQSGLNAAADAQRKLKAVEKEAAQKRDARRSELEKARTIFHRHHREAEKLAQIVKKRSMELARKRLVFAEASDDELHRRAVAEVIDPPAASRSGNA